ncbi:MAG TPA: mobile mystery protein B [Candidatus Acidoferrum sp.]
MKARNAPLHPDQAKQLIPALLTKEAVNQYEEENISSARAWVFSPRRLAHIDPFDELFVRELHRRMFDKTWRWAGKYRNTESNLGLQVHEILQNRVGALLGNGRDWVEHKVFPPDEIAVRFHHGLVLIHPFPDGNGRHGRLYADMIARKLARPEFTWGSANLVRSGKTRDAYLRAMKVADAGDIKPLLAFARS